MWTQGSFKVGRQCLSAALVGTLIVIGGCAKKTKTEQVAPPPAALQSGGGIVTGAIAAPAQTSQADTIRKNPGTVTGVKTAALGTSKSAVATRTKNNKITLSFPKKGYALSGDQSARLAGFVRDAKKKGKRVKVVGIATPQRGAKSKTAMKKARAEANRRAKATSMFLRVYGLEDKDMSVTTADQKARKGVSSRRVEVVFQ